MYGYGPQVAASMAVAATGTPQSTNPAPSPTRPVAVAQIAETLHAPCTCADWRVRAELAVDEAFNRMLDLMASGVGQWEASREVWGTT
jgi:hypothetical protein